MRIETLELTNFRPISSAKMELNGKSTVFFGINGTGKSSILRAINLLFSNIINLIVNRSELKQNYTMQLEDIQFGKQSAEIKADIFLEEKVISYYRGMIRNNGKKFDDKVALKKIADYFHDKYISDENQKDIPVFVNYGTNRQVLDIPLRIRTHHVFDIYSAFENAIQNNIEFRTFFEWYRNQEDYENEMKIETKDLSYKDKSLEAVRTAVLSMLDECSNLRVVRKPRLEMKVDKGEISLNVSQMSDGEKCTLALLGDLARRLSLANPGKDNPLLGEGIVLIDELDLHMHPSWQRSILSTLRTVFPNIQFIVTTHSPIILSEADDNYNLFYIEKADGTMQISKMPLLNGYDINAVLEQFMGTKSLNENTERLIHAISVDIKKKKYEEAEQKIEQLSSMTSSSNPDVIMASMEIRKRRKM